MPVIAKSGRIASSGKLSNLTVIIPIMAEEIIKANPYADYSIQFE